VTFNGAVFEHMRYFITFACYGSHLHGDDSGSVDRAHRLFGGSVVESDAERAAKERGLMEQPAYVLDSSDGRNCVLEALLAECLHRGWVMLAAHVRSTHVHVIVEAEEYPEKILNTFKSYASRYLNRIERETPGRKRWARHGSTRWLWNDADVRSAVQYVVQGRGEPMAVFVSEGFL
jgi:REP element-mobilizing transposase RayT